MKIYFSLIGFSMQVNVVLRKAKRVLITSTFYMSAYATYLNRFISNKEIHRSSIIVKIIKSV